MLAKVSLRDLKLESKSPTSVNRGSRTPTGRTKRYWQSSIIPKRRISDTFLRGNHVFIRASSRVASILNLKLWAAGKKKKEKPARTSIVGKKRQELTEDMRRAFFDFFSGGVTPLAGTEAARALSLLLLADLDDVDLEVVELNEE